jgi:predicted nuclease with TOPRIM domain
MATETDHSERMSWASKNQQDFELVAQELSSLSEKVSDLRERMTEVEKVNAQLEEAALSTARALQQIAVHWDAVYEVMRREEIAENPGDVLPERD